MPLNPQTVQLPFVGGIDEATAPQLADPRQAFHAVSNLTHTKRGALSKAPGTDATAYTSVDLDGVAITSGRTLDSYGDRLVMTDASGVVRVWSPSFNAWAEAGQLPECTVTRRAVAGTQSETPYLVAAYEPTNDVYVVVWVQYRPTNGWLRAAVVERSTGVVLAEDWIDEGEHCRIATVGTNVAVTFVNGTGNVVLFYLDCSDPTAGWTDSGLGWSGSDLDTPSGTLIYDMMPVGSTALIIAYGLAAGTDRIQLRRVETAGWTLTHSATVATASATPVALAIGGTDVCWVTYAYGPAARAVCLSVTDLSSVGTTATWRTFGAAPVWLAVVSSGTQTATVMGSSAGATLNDSLTARAALGISAGAVTTTAAAVLLGQPFMGAGSILRVGTDDYVPLWDQGIESVSLVRFNYDSSGFSDGVVVASFAPRLLATGSAAAVAGPMHAKPMSLGGSQYAWAWGVRRGPGAYSAEVVELDFTPARPSRALFAESLQFAGGVLTQYDGRDVDTVSFVGRPTVAATTGTSGSGVANGTYSYVAVFERVDAAGQWHPGAPSDPFAVTVSGGPRPITAVISQPHEVRVSTERHRIALYRTTDGNSVYYLVAYVPIEPVAAYSTYVDTASDTTIEANATLYTQPGTLGTSRPRRAPPALRDICVHQDRLAGVAEDGVTIWYSAPRVRGEGAWFDDAFQMQVEDGGDITAVWSQDSRLIVAKRRGLYVIDGDGPPENGGNGNEFSPPTRLPVHVGAIDSRAICTSDAGTFFRSERGIELLTRSMQVMWIGEAIEDTVSTYPDVASAVVEPLTSLVRFLLVDDIDAPTAGVVAVYDTNNKSWELRTTPTVAVDQCLHDGAWHYLDADGQVYVETPSSYLDGSTWRTASVETAWISMGMLQEQRTFSAHLLYERHTDHDLVVELAYDHDDSTWVPHATFDSDDVLANDGQIEIRPPNARARAVKLRISDATPSGTANTVGTGRGSTWIGLALDIAPRVGGTKGAPRVGADARR